MKVHLAILIVCVCIVIALSLAFIPNEKEIALINYKEGQYSAAQKIYTQRLSAGDWSVSSVMPLIQIYSYFGDVLTAIEVLERFIDLNPDHLEALTLIGSLYKNAQLSSKYLDNLERLMQLTPNEQGLRELSGLYAYTSQPEKRINALRKLIDHYEYYANDLFGIAYLLARQGQLAEAAQILIRANLEDPDKLDMTARKTLLSLLLKLNRMTDVLHVTKGWIENGGSVEQDIAYYSDWLLSRGYADPAFRLLQQLVDSNDSAESLRLVFIRAAQDSGHREIAHSQLKSWREKGQLTNNLFSLFLEATLATGSFEMALQEVKWWLSLQHSPDRLLFGLIKYAYLHGKLASLDKMLAAVDPGLLKERPVIGIEAALARNERDSALTSTKHAQQRTDLSVEEQIVLAYQLGRMGQLEQVLIILRTLVHSALLPVGICNDLTKIYIDIGRASEGLSHFEILRKTRPSAEIQNCWAMLAATEGQEGVVLEWVRDQSSIDDTVLRELYTIAHNNGHHELALAGAQRLFFLRPIKQHEYYFATALLEVNQVDEAVLILEHLIPAEAVIEETYMKALKAANRNEQLISYGLARLGSDKLDEKGESVFIRALIDVDAYEAVLPHLRRVAQEKAALWAYDYQQVLRKLNLNAERHDYLMTRLGQEALSAEERRQLAFDLLEMGDKKTAITTFKQLASRASIESQDVQQLFYLWGPYPGKQALDWIEHKAVNAAPKERAQWFQQLVQYGGADRVVRRLETSDNGMQDFMMAVYAEALAAEGEWQKLAEHIRQIIVTEDDRMVLGRYAALAAQTKDHHTVEAVWRVILEKNANDKDALRELGLLSYEKNRFLDAESYLSEYQAHHGEDYEVNYTYAQVLLNLRRDRDAITYFQHVLSQLQSLSERHYHDIWIEAMTLQHLGRFERSIAVFERLLEQRPSDLNLRADFASMLLDNGMLKRAQLVIEQH